MSFNKINFDESIEWNPQEDENINLQISTNSISGIIKEIVDNKLIINLSKPVCIDYNMMIILSKNINRTLTIIANGYLEREDQIIHKLK